MKTNVALCSLALSALGLAACEPKDFTLTVSKLGTGAGTVTGTGIDCGSDCTEGYASGASVSLLGTPASGSSLGDWTGCDSVAGNVCTLSIAADRSVSVSFQAGGGSRILISEDITAATTWATGNTYQVTKDIDITATLTIQPGVTVLFDPNTSFIVTGAIAADGQSASSPIIFSSSKPSPAGGDWEGIKLGASGSVFKHCQLLYAGANDKAALEIGDGFTASVTNCVFAHHRTPTDAIDAHPALDASSAAAGTLIKDNLFYDNRAPLSVNVTFSVEANTFDNAAAAPAAPQANKYNAVFIRGCGHITTAITWPSLAVPYVIGEPSSACKYIDVDASGQLHVGQVDAPAVVKLFEAGRIAVAGVLEARAIFTAIADDRQGDTNGDGAATAPAGGAWGGIDLRRSGSIIEHSSFFYAGGGASSALELKDGISASITGSVFAFNTPTMNAIHAAPALDASKGAEGTTIQGNTFYANTVPLSINTTYSIDDSNRFVDPANVAAANTYQAIIVAGCGHIQRAIQWAAVQVPLVIGDPVSSCNYVAVDGAGQLTIRDQTVIKLFPGGKLTALGVIVANAVSGIVLTSVRDDAHGGDTNADAAASAAAPGDWGGVFLNASGSSFQKVSFLYAGGAAGGDDSSALSVATDKSVSVTNSVFAHTRPATDSLRAAPALDLSEAAGPGTVVTGNTFFDNTIPLSINAALSLDDSNVFEVVGTTANRYNGVIVNGCGHVGNAINWLITKVPLVIGDPVSACNYLVVDNGGHLSLGPNLTMKFFVNGRIDVAVGGRLTIDATDWLTCIVDDHLTDTNADGAATTPASGDWRGVMTHHTGADPTCDQSAYMHYYTPNNGDGSCSW